MILPILIHLLKSSVSMGLLMLWPTSDEIASSNMFRPSEFLLNRFLIPNTAGTHWNESHKHRPKMDFCKAMVLTKWAAIQTIAIYLVIILFSILTSIIIKWHKEKLHIKWITSYWMFYKLSAQGKPCVHVYRYYRYIETYYILPP